MRDNVSCLQDTAVNSIVDRSSCACLPACLAGCPKAVQSVQLA
jgi:hypothetical protein